jgi:predicted RNA binding protein YcfA (HicA-like mRNA interferase family)
MPRQDQTSQRRLHSFCLIERLITDQASYQTMTSRELLHRLRRAGATIVTDRGKGGHIMVQIGGRRAFVPTGSGDMKRGTVLGILKELGLQIEDLD